MLEVAQEYERAFGLILDEDANFLHYLTNDSGGKDALGPSTKDDWNNVRHFVKFLHVIRRQFKCRVPCTQLPTCILVYFKMFIIVL